MQDHAQTGQSQDHDMRPTRQVVEDAIGQWEALTGVKRDASSFTFGTLSVAGMNKMLDEALELDPEGTTGYLLLECFLRYFLEQKTFSAAQIMRDYASSMGFLAEAEKLFSVVQSDRAVEIGSSFRARVRAGLSRYGADRPEVLEMLDDPDVLPFLRRDALRSLNKLTAYQFLAGKADGAHPQVVEHVFMAWSVNDLLSAMRDMSVSGIALVLMRDPAHPERSYFTFAMRNGENVILFTDKRKPAYPGQADRLALRGGRGAARAYAEREEENHFPYQIIPTGVDDRGDTTFLDETAPVAAGLSLAPMMRIADLPPDQAIWVTMMLSLIVDRFWKQGWTAPELSYTGAMIEDREAIVRDAGGALLPMAQGYQQITLEPVTKSDITAEAMAAQFDQPPIGLNAWIEARYKDTIDDAILNLWHPKGGETLYLPSVSGDRFSHAWTRESREIAGGVMAGTPDTFGFRSGAGYALQTFSEAEFGSESELQADRLFIARTNFSKALQKAADTEFKAREAEVEAWYRKAIEENFSDILKIVGRGGPNGSALDRIIGKARYSVLSIGPYNGEFRSFLTEENSHGWEPYDRKKYRCVINDTAASWRAQFTPRTFEDLMLLTGKTRDELPDVLQNWALEKRSLGNHLLNRLDPVDNLLHDPWCKMTFWINIFLSKRALSALQAGMSPEA